MFNQRSCLLLMLVILVVLSLAICCICTSSPSSCGTIRNISCPLRLEGRNQRICNDPFTFELACDDNNRTIFKLPTYVEDINFNYHTYYVDYYVEDINYDNHSIRLVDPGLEKNNCSSLPLHSLSTRSFYNFDLIKVLSKPIIFFNCPTPAISTRYKYYTSTDSCYGLDKKKNYFSYVVVGSMRLSEVEDNCEVGKTAWVSSQWDIMNKTSFSSIHDAMVYGFELSWDTIYCLNCEAGSGYCDVEDWHNGTFKYKGCKYYTTHCSFTNLSSYQPSLHCLRENLNDIRIYLNEHVIRIREIMGAFFGARFLCGIIFLLSFLVYKWKRRHWSVYDTIEDFLQGHNNLMPIRYSYYEIKKITNGFKDKLGEGGFGTVYKGKLRSGILVAVKIMGKSKATGQEFINEVATIGRIHHVNVVQLIGFCFEGSKRALIYEFMPNGSLEKYIFNQEEKEDEDEEKEEIVSLSCKKMYDISLKVARGIEYLHKGCDMQILHFDIKPHNVLLDKNFNPKISDFGLAKLYATDDSIVTLTAARGTMGYMAPELFYKNIGGVSFKADVYSFGMLLMEMAGRRKNLNPFVDKTSQIYFPSWIYDQFNQGRELEMEDATDEEKKLVKKMILAGLWCIQLKPSDRPSMAKVIEMLEGEVELLVMPPNLFLCPQDAPAEDQELNTTPPVVTSIPSTDIIIQGSD